MLLLSWVPHSHCLTCHNTLSLLIYASSSTTRQTVSSLKPGTYFNPVANPPDLHRTDWLRGDAELTFVELMDLWGFLFGLSWKFMRGGDLEFSPWVWVPFSEGVSCFDIAYLYGNQYEYLLQRWNFYDSETKAWARAQRWIHLDEFGGVCTFSIMWEIKQVLTLMNLSSALFLEMFLC